MARRSTPWYRKDRKAWFVTINGSRHNLGPEKKAAFDRFYQLMRQPKQHKVTSDSFAGIADAFLEWVQKNRSEATYEWYRYRLQRFIEKYPDLKASEIRPFHVENWVSNYQFSVTSRRNYLRSVKRCMMWACKMGYLDRNPISELEVPSAEHKEVALSQEEFETLLSFVCDDAFEDLLMATWETGCRPQESLRVESRHVDLTHHRWVFSKSESKMKKTSRVVYLTDTALSITKRLMFAHPVGPIFQNSNGKDWTTEAVNCAFDRVQRRMGRKMMDDRGEEISPEVIQDFIPKLKKAKSVQGKVIEKSFAELRCEAKRKLRYKRAAELAPRYSLYALRHSWATNALQRGVDPLTVAILMGHQDPSTLSKVYQHLSFNPQHMLEQAKKAAG